jgi:hypothetical protein
MSKRNFKFKVGDVVYIFEFEGYLPIIFEGTIVNVFRDSRGNICYDTNIKDFIDESSVFKTKKQALKKLKHDVKDIINQMKSEIKNLEEEIKLENK